jgi:hypothetical protein
MSRIVLGAARGVRMSQGSAKEGNAMSQKTVIGAAPADDWERGVLIGLERVSEDPRRPFDAWAPRARPARAARARGPGRIEFDVCVDLGAAPRLA